jgi:hypothetical protein
MAKMNLLKGIASLFKSKGKDVAEGVVKPEKVFAQNLIDEFGDVEVKEAFRIIDDRTPELEKLFYREGESKMDDLVNLLESRYMSSDRLQAHPLSFKRRGPGAADRYAKINDTGGRLTDLPGGPGDRVLYFKHYGEMSPTVIQGKKVYDRPPSIFDEGTKVADEGQTIEGTAKAVDDDLLLDQELFKEGQKAVKDLQKAGVMDETGGIPVGKVMDDMVAGMTDESDAILKNMKKMEAEAKAMSEIAMAEQQEIGSAIDTFNRMMDAGDDPAEALNFLQAALKKTRTKQAEGGRVEMALGGAAKGIMEAIKLAARGIKPFGQKQTYKQKVKMTGMDEFQKGMKKQFDKELYLIDKGRAGNPEEELFDLYEDIVAGKRYSMLPEATKSNMLSKIEDSMKAMEVDGGDYQNFRRYLQDQYGFADPTGTASGPGIDRFPNFPAGTGLEALQKGIDKGQIKTMKADDLMKALKNIEDRESGANVIPFKPREKKFKGGIAGLLKRIMSPKLEKEMVEKGPFQTGHRSDIVGDMEQIKNVSRNEGVTLERLDSLYDMVQESPRYNEAMRGAMMKLVDYERFRAILLDDNVKLQRMLQNDPEGSEKFIRMLFREGGSEPQFNLGGLVPPQKGPMSEGMGTLYRRK